jgi:hypothetical protein
MMINIGYFNNLLIKSTSFAGAPYIDPGARGTQYILPYAYHIYTAVRPQDYQGLRVHITIRIYGPRITRVSGSQVSGLQGLRSPRFWVSMVSRVTGLPGSLVLCLQGLHGYQGQWSQPYYLTHVVYHIWVSRVYGLRPHVSGLWSRVSRLPRLPRLPSYPGYPVTRLPGYQGLRSQTRLPGYQDLRSQVSRLPQLPQLPMVLDLMSRVSGLSSWFLCLQILRPHILGLQGLRVSGLQVTRVSGLQGLGSMVLDLQITQGLQVTRVSGQGLRS